MNVPSQHTTDMVILQNAFTDALSSMNKSQSALLQQLQINFSKSIENSLKPVIDNLKTQSLVFQQLRDNICKKENIKHDKQPDVEKLRDKIKQLQEENTLLRTEIYETVVKISKLESQLEYAKIRNENSRTKLETSVRSLTDENASLREHRVQCHIRGRR